MRTSRFEAPSRLPPSAVLAAGLWGGLAEVVWVAAYAAATPASGWEVAREVTLATFGSAVGGSFAPAVGLSIHFALAVAVAAVFAATLWRPLARRAGSPGVLAGSIGALAAIWATNFFVVLPIVHPPFVALLPLSVTLASKLLFGIAMGIVLARETAVHGVGAERQLTAG